jgi:predicted nucleotidyltransferase
LDSERVLTSIDPALARFAERLRDELGAERVLLFGSHARGTAYWDSDYDLIIVAEHFGSLPRLERSIGLHEIFYEAGGNAPLDLICLTPDEFERARQRIGLISAVLPEAVDLLSVTSAP